MTSMRESRDRRELDPIEIASRDEIAALQVQRLQWSLKHACENVPHYKAALDAAETIRWTFAATAVAAMRQLFGDRSTKL